MEPPIIATHYTFWLRYGYALLVHDYTFATRLSEMSWGSYTQLTLVHYGCCFTIGGFLWQALIKHQHGSHLLLTPVLLLT